MASGSYERKSFTGGAQPTALSALISGTPSSFTVASGGGASYPDGSAGPFVVVLGRGTASEEKILVSTRVSDTFNIDTRGYDNTSAVDHDLGEVVEHVLDASTIDQANRYVNLQSAKGDVVVHNGTNAVGFSVGADDTLLVADSALPEGVGWKAKADADVASATGLSNLAVDVAALPQGIVAVHYFDGQLTYGNTPTNILTVSFTADPTRQYKLNLSTWVSNYANISIDMAGSPYGFSYNPIEGRTYASFLANELLVGASGSITIDVYFYCSVIGQTAIVGQPTKRSALWITDEGLSLPSF